MHFPNMLEYTQHKLAYITLFSSKAKCKLFVLIFVCDIDSPSTRLQVVRHNLHQHTFDQSMLPFQVKHQSRLAHDVYTTYLS